ncbi:glycerophosphodiester phosphodiesterase family protein [Actinoallomurus sp. NPDC052308]|uniref:glycerophosphodiester phosphodiesterase n=1 Tax=Actinoallomurus sp. NPDC052308 TaxID=3155530 RepID=UPI0034443801
MRKTMLSLAAVGLTVVGSATAVQAAPFSPQRSTTRSPRLTDLPQRFFIAHRSAGAFLAPENTEQALKAGVADPDADLLEFDIQVLKDGVGGVMHDPTVDRVTTGTGNVADFDSAAFQKLVIDAPSWFGGKATTTHPLLFTQVLDEFAGKTRLLAHPKTTEAMRLVIDELTRRNLTGSVMVQTFSRSDAVLAEQAGITAQVIVGGAQQATIDTPEAIKADGLKRVSVWSALPDSLIASYVKAGLTVACYDVNRQYRRDELYRLGVQGIDTNDPPYVRGDVARYRRTRDPFTTQNWWYGQISQSQYPEALGPRQRGRFIAPGWWHVNLGDYPLLALQGWAVLPKSYTLRLKMRWDSLGTDKSRWGGVYFSAVRDSAFTSADSPLNGGYLAVLRRDGTLILYRKDAGHTTRLKSVRTPALKKGTIATLRISVTKSSVTVVRYDGPDKSITAKDSRYRGRYLYLGRYASTGHQGPGLSFGGVSIG